MDRTHTATRAKRRPQGPISTLWASVAVALAATLVVHCADRIPNDSKRRSRVDAVKAAPAQAVDLDAFCDVRQQGPEAPEFSYPPLDGQPPKRAGRHWTWINVWATWCAPCLEEMPMMLGWRKRLSEGKSAVHMEFLSVDESAAEVTKFRGAHAWLPASGRTADPEALGPWLQSLGLTDQTAIPVHVFVDPQNKVRCARAGGIAHHHLRAIEQLTGR